MADLSAFPITRRWVPRDPTKLQLFSFPTPNGVKVAIALEELRLPYEAHRVTLSDEDVKSDAFLSLNPNNKIPAIIDPDGPDGTPIGLFESGAILLYLARKTGRLTGPDATSQAHATQWLMWQMGGLGPMLGQLGYFVKFAGKEIDDPRPRQRYVDEARRLLSVFAGALQDREWIVGEFTIADIAIAPWLNALEFYGAKDIVGWSDHPVLEAYVERFMARDAAKVGMNTPPRESATS
ncbi:glutathione S-transferase N-terminal domain-containing protein [Jannaschia sp. S6380]|uniref:glutathione S-transferase family protein n=1 Tax=Jannaschia sp. S6380 TaxID=2926408 RepID=UPI001FF6E024|nr:glutathione S-transferase N-terminal domain-containing protein [Jannaschia sp. S6380]MCK0167844.1 glutathione S-transferase N-terminal domain-containing protein [Jannaschia sp. S6380]